MDDPAGEWLGDREVTRDGVTRCELAKLRLLGAAALLGDEAPRVEDASRGRIERARQITAENDALTLHLHARIRHGHRRHERMSVGMQGMRKELLARGVLDDVAEVHHGDALRDLPHDR